MLPFLVLWQGKHIINPPLIKEYTKVEKSCQTIDWNKGHKGDCKVLKDPELQGLFRLGWSEFKDYHAFR